MPNKINPWAKINESPPKYQIGDIVYTYLTFGDKFINVPARELPKKCIIQLSKAVVIGYETKESEYEDIPKWLPCYVVRTLKIYVDYAGIEKLGEEHSVNRWWIEQGDDAYAKYFGKYPRRGEFVFR